MTLTTGPTIQLGLYPTPSRGLSTEQLAEVTARAEQIIRDRLPEVTEQDWADGLVWYEDANRFVRKVAREYGQDWLDMGWCLALLSPQNRWDQNKQDLIDLLETGDCGALPLGTGRALSVLAGEVGEEIAGVRKVRSFAFNIISPHGSYDVTLDSHMANVLQLPSVKYLERKGIYDALSNAFRNVAEEIGVMPHQLQAALWINTRGGAQ